MGASGGGAPDPRRMGRGGAGQDRGARAEPRDRRCSITISARWRSFPDLSTRTHTSSCHICGHRCRLPTRSSPGFAASWRRGASGRTPQSSEILDGIRAGIDEAVRTGTALVGDISNTLVTYRAAGRQSACRRSLFYELIRFNAPTPPRSSSDASPADRCAARATPRVRPSLAAHAPYSVAPLVFRAIRDAIDRRPFVPCSVHLSESRDEVEFIATGDGRVAPLPRGGRLVGSGRGSRRASVPSDSWTTPVSSTSGCSPCTACR